MRARRDRNKTKQMMKAIHRDVGALVIGLTVIFSLTGIILIYRDADFLKFENTIEKQLDVQLESGELRKALDFRRLRVSENSDEKIVFRSGVYDKKTGLVRYTTIRYPRFIQKAVNLHKYDSRDLLHWVSLVYGILLFLLAVSSFWMYQPGSKKYKRFLSFTVVGIALALVILFFA